MSDVPSFQKRLLTTSWRDAIRLRLSGDLDWHGEIQRSDLPEDLQIRIRALVRESRLLRTEKTDVAREMVAHFQDGHDRGVSFDQMVADFGDPKVAAQLIHRSKKRNRSFMMKTIRVMGWGVLGLVGVYAAMFVFFHMARPDVRIDFLAEINEPHKNVSVAEKAWPIYRDAWLEHGVSENGFSEIVAGEASDWGNLKSRLVQPEDKEWEAAVAFINGKQELVESLKLAASRPVLGLELQAHRADYSKLDERAMFPESDYPAADGHPHWFGDANFTPATRKLVDGNLLDVFLPHVKKIRACARLIEFDSLIAIEEQDSARVVENFKALFAMANHVAESNFLVCGLSAITTTENSFKHLEEVLTDHQDVFSDEQLLEIQNIVQEMVPHSYVTTSGERKFMYDMMQRVYSDNGNGDGRITVQGLEILEALSGSFSGPEVKLSPPAFRTALGPASLFALAGRKETRKQFDEWMDVADAQFKTPWHAHSDEVEKVEEALRKNEIKFALLGMLMPATNQIDNYIERSTARRDGIAMALALLRFHRQHENWPESNDGLVPDFINGIPIGPVSGQPIQFKIKNDMPIIYGFGSDLDDDGGQPIFYDEHDSTDTDVFLGIDGPSNPTDGDWVLWPSTWNR